MCLTLQSSPACRPRAGASLKRSPAYSLPAPALQVSSQQFLATAGQERLGHLATELDTVRNSALRRAANDEAPVGCRQQALQVEALAGARDGVSANREVTAAAYKGQECSLSFDGHTGRRVVGGFH